MMQSFETYMEEKSIVESLRFYLMLGIVVSTGREPQHANKSLNQFLIDLKEKRYSPYKVNQFISRAAKSLPSEFRSIFNIPEELRR